MNRGICFRIPNKYGRFIQDILGPLDCELYDWLIGSGQTLQTVDGQLIDEDLFDGNKNIKNGSE
jgi:hypothetical protein